MRSAEVPGDGKILIDLPSVLPTEEGFRTDDGLLQVSADDDNIDGTLRCHDFDLKDTRACTQKKC